MVAMSAHPIDSLGRRELEQWNHYDASDEGDPQKDPRHLHFEKSRFVYVKVVRLAMIIDANSNLHIHHMTRCLLAHAQQDDFCTHHQGYTQPQHVVEERRPKTRCYCHARLPGPGDCCVSNPVTHRVANGKNSQPQNTCSDNNNNDI